MKTFFAVAIPVAMLSILAIAAPAASAQTGAAQCIATYVAPGSRTATIYVSQVVPTHGQAAALNGAWGMFVQSTYHLEKLAQATCNAFGADPAQQQRVLAAEQNAWAKNNLQVVQVNWTMGQPARSNSRTNPYASAAPPGDAPKDAPPKDAPGNNANGNDAGGKDAPPKDAGAADAAPPPDQDPRPRASYCYSDDTKPTVYFSDPFDTADLPSSKAWSSAFSKFLTQKYMYKGAVTCKDQPTISKVMSAVLDQKDTLQGKQTVDTDWTYQPPAPGEAPPPEDAAATKPKSAKSATPKPATPKPQ